ncbi:MAG: transcriptional repressor NrdR [Myxococcales bacterium]|nr:transcriptional repressor NrdR [Myxococcales bacterium]MCB9733901.1 transcriptional repressor NrdR [Deltaproteobacteria bacterium]
MRCPFCSEMQNRVIDSRMARDGRAIRRRRACEGCGERFTTYESIESPMADVEKREGQNEPFDKDKVTRSIRLACKKRPVPLTAITAFAERLESKVSSLPRKTIRSSEIGAEVLAFLRAQDPVAYVRYASVYRSFGSIAEFTRELETFAAEGPGPAIDDDDDDGLEVGEDGTNEAPSVSAAVKGAAKGAPPKPGGDGAGLGSLFDTARGPRR